MLRPGGRVCLRNTTLEQLETYPYLDFFPSVAPVIAAKLSPRAEIQGLFAAAGLDQQAHEVVDHPIAANWLGYADKVGLRADSFLQQIPDEDFGDGLAALRAYAEKADPNAPVARSFEVFLFRRA